MKAISVRAPWWWYILYGGKDIENRNWPTHQRGVVYLHASKYMGPDVRGDLPAAMQMAAASWTSVAAPTLADLKERAGCLVGTVEVVDCVRASGSAWFQGGFGFVLRNPVAFQEPVPCKGALGWFDVPVFGEGMSGEGTRAAGNLSLFGGERDDRRN